MKKRVNGYCDGNPASEWPCSHPATFFVRYADSPTVMQACGKHLAAQVLAYPIPTQESRFIVVPCNPNVEALQ